uniref:Uncharacterized protein n=1 Tax=Knipowitschia caucasica TaxID=637954 RepID=A0AAV2JE79_KNICA
MWSRTDTEPDGYGGGEIEFGGGGVMWGACLSLCLYSSLFLPHYPLSSLGSSEEKCPLWLCFSRRRSDGQAAADGSSPSACSLANETSSLLQKQARDMILEKFHRQGTLLSAVGGYLIRFCSQEKEEDRGWSEKSSDSQHGGRGWGSPVTITPSTGSVDEEYHSPVLCFPVSGLFLPTLHDC